ncbi:hypothetical protein HN388_05620 [bacterium]|jgi:uncharacterized membrane protein|nr:hypothetical protein [bacterium]
MFNTVEEYLDALKQEMQGVDSATIQDALVDSEEHLQSALEGNPEDTLHTIIEEYGSPEETAASYAEVERRTSPALSGSAKKEHKSWLGNFFGIYADPRAWGSLFYMFIAFVTGIIYFTWAVTGTSISISLAILIIGLPIAFLFLLSVRGIAWFEGRLVEALLGVRMPRRSLPAPQNRKLLKRITGLFKEKHTWLSLLYMFTQLVLGNIYFVVLVTLLSLSISGIVIPVSQEIFNSSCFYFGSTPYYFPQWWYPLLILAGFLQWTATMHLAKWIGNLHGRYARAMLIARQD